MKTLDDYKGTFPYASELFGVYQPLIGWRSQRTKDRYDKYRSDLYDRVVERAMTSYKTPVEVDVAAMSGKKTVPFLASGSVKVRKLEPLSFSHGTLPHVTQRLDSAVARLVFRQVSEDGSTEWAELLTKRNVKALLRQVEEIALNADQLEDNPDIADYVNRFLSNPKYAEDPKTAFQKLFEREAVIAGYLVLMAEENPAGLDLGFGKKPKIDLLDVIRVEDPLLNFGANDYDAILSPLGVIHLYREYFFEFDSFLGPPVGHVWLSPGGTVELIEINTRKTFTERTFETFAETITRTETTVTTQDELADAVKDENQSSIKFGFSNVASYTTPVFQDTATASFSLDNAKTHTRETTQKQMRQQSEKLSSEIKKNYKTTYKTSTEVTDTTSKRYVLQNTTKKLVNYELRRKMRKVGVQVQDIGVQLCWHTFVDDPGRDIGVARLVHIAQPAELSDLPQPDAPPMPQIISQDININIPFVGLDTDDNDMAYTDGAETEVGAIDSEEHIQPNFPQSVTFTQPGYTLASVTLDAQGANADVSVLNLVSTPGSSTGSFTVHLDYVNFGGQPSINLAANLVWEPSQESRDAATAEATTRQTAYTEEKARRYKEVFYKAARERINAASKISPRPAYELREEERTVVYRSLISQLMRVGPHEAKHIISELVRSIFDVDKMLYFVAPEWWTTRLHQSRQHLGSEMLDLGPVTVPAGGLLPVGPLDPSLSFVIPGPPPRPAPIAEDNLVDWGGGQEAGRDNYFITEESAPAHFGSSLGWLLQLDGDNLRNAFLNSPWVKAVIPIRPGKELQAINWLRQAHVEGEGGLDVEYVAAEDDPPALHSTRRHRVTVEEALRYLIGRIGEFNENSRRVIAPNPADPDDPRNHFAGSLPGEAIFEHGFNPLEGGVRFDQDATDQVIFAQWMEILPTDQVVALQVEYDPKTLQIRDIEETPENDDDVEDDGDNDEEHDDE